MALFNNPKLIELPDGRFELTEPLRFSLRMGVGEFRIIVPAGFTTDFASVPRIFWPCFPPRGKYSKAAILHDFLYSKAGSQQCSRFLADAIFRDVMLQCGTCWCQAFLMYMAVRIFGYFAWRTR